MRFILIGLVFYLLVTAYFAAQRVARKRQMRKYSAQNSTQNLAQSSSTTIPEPSAVTPQAVSAQENSAGENAQSSTQAIGSSSKTSSSESTAQQGEALEMAASALIAESAPTPEDSGINSANPIAEAEISAFNEQDIALPEPESAPVQEIVEPATQNSTPDIPAAISAPELPAPEIPQPVTSEASSEVASSPSLPIGSPAMINPDADLILAASMSVTGLVNPQSSASVEIPDLIPTDPAISEVLNANAEPTRTHHPSILEEIAELRPTADAPSHQSSDDRTRRFMHALLTGDGTVRVAAVYELGEIAAQGSSDSEQIIQQLQQLIQDEDPDVRLQAIAALEKVRG